ncbi:uncharacterized protein LOC120077362 [Benincasa hispida]|uniref:uncharacterized protein LOC120077362 n=1 Tax=Benincasa hispida TaxID=102211 RepID=UPI001901213D|nr:uncharacterized protein LOC120077362 [Benincasa hispida]
MIKVTRVKYLFENETQGNLSDKGGESENTHKGEEARKSSSDSIDDSSNDNRIVVERDLSEQAQDCLKFMSLLVKVEIVYTLLNLEPYYPNLVREFYVNLSHQFNNVGNSDYRKVHRVSDMLGSRKVNCLAFSVKYVLLHKIGIENWFPSSHKFGLSTTLASLLYQIDTGAEFNYGVLNFNQIKRHIGSQATKVLSCFHRLICGILLAQKPNLLLNSDVPRPLISTLSFSYRLYQGKHVPDLVHTDVPVTENGPARKFLLTPCEKKMMHMLANESKDLGVLAQNVSACKIEVDDMLNLLRSALDGTNHGESFDARDDNGDV